MNKIKKSVVWYKSLTFTIIVWFLPLSLIPVLLISYDSNKTTIEVLDNSVFENMKDVSLQEKKFISNWFYYRESDVEHWAKMKSSQAFLLKLSGEFKKNNTSLQNFINTKKYMNIASVMEDGFKTLFKQYDYIDNIYFIDKKGNILYSVKRESDLGTNLLNGEYSKTKFSQVLRETLKDEKLHFSDLELYKPSNAQVRGFFTSPIMDTKNRLIGAFAVSIKMKHIYKLFGNSTSNSNSFVHYLVGKDTLLRSKISSNSEILQLKIHTKQFKLWFKEHVKKEKVSKLQDNEEIFIYKGPYSNEVMGVHQNINILGVEWVLISELSTDSINQVTTDIIKKAIIYIVVLMLIVIIISILISRRIVKPVLELSKSVNKFSEGDRDVVFNIKNEGEIGRLAIVFENMMDSLKKNELELMAQTVEAKKSLNALDEQKLALNSHAIVAITDTKGNITFVNDKFVEISGYSKEELIGNNHRILNSGEHSKEYWKDMYSCVSSGTIWSDTICNIAKNGEKYWVDTTIVPFMGEQNKPISYIAIRTDVTQQILLQHNLIQAKEVAEESVKTKAEFLASMSHEIRTPMNGVIGMLSLLMNTKLNDSQRHQAYLAQSSASALLALINDILDFSKVEAGKLELDNVEFDLRKELGDFAEAIAFRAQEKGIELVLDLVQVDITTIKADYGRIRQILNNIVGNSIKFTSKGHILIKVALHVLDEESARLNIKIEDTGIGIPLHKIETLFDSFSQVDASTTRKYGGTGLGLAIVKKLCELMDGSVKVSSELGVGSSFEVDIKVSLTRKSSLVAPRIDIKNKKALLVDASRIHMKMMRIQLEHWGMEVECVTNSEEALHLLDASFDIAFIDKDIQKLCAEELADTVKENTKLQNLKLVIMTAVSDRRDINTYIRHAYDAHFPKPATTSDMFNALNVLEQGHKTLAEIHEGEESELIEFSKWPENTKILLVDDNKVNQLVANGLLEELGLEADIANNGAQALEKLKDAQEIPYTIVLMDCQMPVMDGYEATRKIKAGETGEQNSNITVIAMTANAMQGDKEKCFAAGMDDYISKPINPKILEEKLKKYLL